MLKLATTIHNPGEPAIDSRYRDPAVLVELGFNGKVLYESTALSGIEGPESLADPEMRRFVQGTMNDIARQVDAAYRAGLGVYLSYDMLVLPSDTVSRNITALTCGNRPTVLCPASELALELSVRALGALLDRYPSAAGIVLRFGDTDAGRLPYLLGNDIYAPHCPRCSQFGRAERIAEVIRRAHDLVVTQRNKRLIVRAWNLRPSGLHDTPELAQRVARMLPGEETDDRLVLAFKFTQTDFWRYQPWNPSSLLFGKRPILYELQCQREFEGKGGVPNWQPALWRDGYPESQTPGAPTGLAQAAQHVNFHGVLAWVRGGGWGGPFISHESWVDANVSAAPKLADNPDAQPLDLARAWARDALKLHSEDAVDAVVSVLERSPELARLGFYVEALTKNKPNAWHPSADWISDDLLDAEACWRMIQRLPFDAIEAVVEEKRRAAQLAADMRHTLQSLQSPRDRATLEPLLNSLLYTESLMEAIRDLFAGLAAYRVFQKHKRKPDADAARRALFEAQSHWNHHTQRHTTNRGAATAYRESGLWELTQRILAEVTA